MSMQGESTSRPVIRCDQSKGAKQSHRKECDINSIVRQYEKTGLLTPVVERPGVFVDVSEVGDYRTALENVRVADDMFMDLPSGIRAEFANDPAEFLDFCTDPDNEDRMREMGLLPELEEEVAKPPPKVEPVDPAPAAD